MVSVVVHTSLVTVIACASAIAGVAVVCLSFLVVLSVVLSRRRAKMSREPEYAEPDESFAKVPTLRRPRVPAGRAIIVPAALDPNEEVPDPAYATVDNMMPPVISKSSSNRTGFKIYINSSYALDEKGHTYEEIGEDIKMNENYAYGCYHPPPREPQSPPEAE